MSGNPAFQVNAFQNNAFQVQAPQSIVVTDTIVKLQKPINCVLAGDQPEEKKSRFITDFSGILKGVFGE